MVSFYNSKFNFLRESLEQEKKIAVIPGSFKPPHKGHYAMIEHYSKMVGPEGQVIVFVSKPSAKNTRKTVDGRVISPETTKAILDIYCRPLKNVTVEVSPVSPVKSAYEIGERLDSGVLIFGCSKKGEDIKRFNQIKNYIESKNPALIVIDPLTTAVNPTDGNGSPVSASDFRAVFGNVEKMKEFLPEHLNDATKEQIIEFLMK